MAQEHLILIDSSIWVDYYRPRGCPTLTAAVQHWIQEDRVATLGVIALEVLRGCLTKKDFEVVKEDFLAHRWIELNAGVIDLAAEIGFNLDRKGHVVPSVDLLIAAAAIRTQCALAHQDRHFKTIAKHFPLRLADG
ncbi:MAG: PIN domain-containing protein [Elusimicrobia bacterium]|nr:PIN domain-containing protein [Elusimicrobiota bacterium]